MALVTSSIEIEMPVRSVYNQWTQFEEFPEFMEGVESVTQLSDDRLHWVAEIAGVRREWHARITEQEPDRIIVWRSEDGTENGGAVMFEALDPMRTRVTLELMYEAESFTEKVGDVLGFVQRRVDGDLERFARFIEERGAETGEWRGRIDKGRVVESDEEARRIRIDEEAPQHERSQYPTWEPSVPSPPREG